MIAGNASAVLFHRHAWGYRAIEFRIALAGEAVDEEWSGLARLGNQAIECPVDRAITKVRRDSQHPLVPFARQGAESWPG